MKSHDTQDNLTNTTNELRAYRAELGGLGSHEDKAIVIANIRVAFKQLRLEYLNLLSSHRLLNPSSTGRST